jgi:hypothetical protein
VAENPEDDILFKEIDEELRQDQWQKLWREYGKYAVAAAIALVVAVAGYKGWQAYDISSRQAEGERFARAMAADEKSEDAFKAFQDIAADGKAGYPLLARFSQARMMARAGDQAGAAAAYRALSDDAGLSPVYRNLAVILGGYQELNTAGADLAALESRLKPMLAKSSPWRYAATEFTGLLAMQAGDKTRARKLFSGLAGDARAPQGVRARAQEMLSITQQ